jgi:uncharacterized membrane protein
MKTTRFLLARTLVLLCDLGDLIAICILHMAIWIRFFWKDSSSQFALSCGILFGLSGLVLLMSALFSEKPEESVFGLLPLLVGIILICYGRPRTTATDKAPK